MNVGIAATVREYISAHPAVKECLRRGVVNHSALAREICKRRGLRNQQAVLAAVRRFAQRTLRQSSLEHGIEKLFNQSKILVRSDMLVAVVRRQVDFKRVLGLIQESRALDLALNVIEGEQVLTIIAHQSQAARIKSALGSSLTEMVKNVAQISLSLPHIAMYTPGVTARLSSILAQGGINILEEMTCSGEYLIVVEEKNLLASLSLLKGKNGE